MLYDVEAIGARYAAPMFPWKVGIARFEAGNLLAFEIPVVRENGRVHASGAPSRVALGLNPVNGIFRGTFRHPTTGRTTAVHGAVLQMGVTNGHGVFRGTSQVGRIRLAPGH